ncbi:MULTISPECIES: polysaccharide deacetylase family protein [unclassified Pantoea]|uniref:polysaccharide deacetylase family protein n=1 Tax=unclassified Pantoea TaxID=2630326 RepID=UPI0012320B2A|nr:MULTISPECIES: polysaccharide deacetylase family protein [unclassified Pantoea]KAA6096686.1 deacetylase [Pantoea sp. B_9]KAA6114322.1 deacetylase [Pantoea sp. B_10]
MEKPAFLITLDTEGDNLWRNRSGKVTTHNVRFLPRFQALCEKYGFKPTWLTNYEMASDPAYVEFGRDLLARGQGEIGMHLHAWYSPPEYALTDDEWRYQPYLIEYPENVLRDKVAYMTDLLENAFQRKMTSHRAGRWAFNEVYARALIDQGYLVDCSVTPRVSWRNAQGAPQGQGGTDYSHFPDRAYFLDEQDISRPGDSPLLELPMSIQYRYGAFTNQLKKVWNGIRGRQRGPSVNWLRPVGGNLAQMKQVAEQTLAQGNDYVEFMLHSSEFMPDGSPTFKTEADIERLYDDLEGLFSWLATRTQGMTLTEFARLKQQQR